jgi:putative DNA primase/helicase
MGLRGVWGHEFAELDSFGRADSARVKNFLSSTVDDYRQPYGRANVRISRRCIFAGSVNLGTNGYLRDESGNRRFWPVLCGETGPIDLEALSCVREQIWAEAREHFKGGGKWWPETREERELLEGEQETRMVSDAWDPVVAQYLIRRGLDAEPRVTIGEVLKEALKIEMGKWTATDQGRAGHAVRKAGWKRVRRGTPGGGPRDRMWVYVPGGTR